MRRAVIACAFVMFGFAAMAYGHEAEEVAMPPVEVSAAAAALLPEDPATDCSPAVQRKATSCRKSWEVYVSLEHFSEDDANECCELLASYFGPNATENGGRSANCFCDQRVWKDTLEQEKISYLSHETIFSSCEALGHTIHYFQAGAGPCEPDGAAAPAPAPVTAPGPAIGPINKSVREWLQSLPDSNPVLIAAIIISIPSVVGFSTVVMWPLTYFSILEGARWVRIARSRLGRKINN